MPIEIRWFTGDQPPRGTEPSKRSFDGRGPFRIGRGAAADVVLDHPQVSRLHAEVTVDGQTVTVTDKGSQNGTLIGGNRITSQVWGPNQPLRIGPFTLSYVLSVRETSVSAPAEPAPAAQAPAPAGAPRRPTFPGRLFDARVVAMKDIRASGKLAEEAEYAAIGGGVGSFCWVDHLRVFGVPTSAIRVIGVASDKRPYAKYARLCRNSQIPDHERLRSNSISAPDNIWGFPGYASREMVRDVLQGRLVGLKHVLQVFGEPALTESYTPRTIDVFRSLDAEAKRIGWEDMWRFGQVVGIRKTDDERFLIAYRVPSQEAPGLSQDQREQFMVARYVHLATGYPASNYLPDLQQFRHDHPNTTAVINAYEEHDEIYRTLEQKGGTVLIRGRGIVASRIIQRLFEARAKNPGIRILHLVRAPIAQGHSYDLATRTVRNDVEQQPFNWPKSCWGGSLRKLLEKSSPDERAKLLATWGGTTTADRDDWNGIIEQGTREGWYKTFYGSVESLTETSGRIVTRLSSTEKYQESVDLTADYIVDCTGLIARIDETPVLADLIRTYDLPRNRAPGDGAELRMSGLAVTNSFEIAGLQNGRGRVWAAGVVTANGPYAAVDSFLGLQYASLRSVDQLGQLKAAGVSRFGPLRSASQWLKWCTGRAP